MKRINILIIGIFVGLFGMNAQMDCSKFYPFQEGATSQLTMYNAKGKSQGMVEYKVVSVSNTGDGTVASMQNRLFDKKGKEISVNEYTALCKDGVVSIDFQSLMRPGMMDAYGEIDAQVTGTNLDLPNDLSVGQTLPDSEMVVTISMGGMEIKTRTAIVDRNVVGKETITVPAGTYECYIIEQTMEMKSMANNMKRKSKQWISEGVGVVKSEDFNRKGNLENETILTSFTN